MEITKGENANLAGMEPRCPKCDGSKLSLQILLGCESGANTKVFCPTCREYLFETKMDTDIPLEKLRQFFRSPAPTPPLDVEAVARELEEEELKRIRAGKLRLTEKEKAGILRRHIASPAQPEKRDEWVSVDNCHRCERKGCAVCRMTRQIAKNIEGQL